QNLVVDIEERALGAGIDVVHGDVGRAAGFLREFDNALDAGLGRAIGGDATGLIAGFAQFRDGLVDIGLRARGDDDLAAFLTKFLRTRQPDTLRTADDQRDLAFYAELHVFLLLFFAVIDQQRRNAFGGAQRRAAIHDDAFAVDVAGHSGSEEQRNVGDFLVGARARHRQCAGELRERVGAHGGLHTRAGDHAGLDAVDGDI